MVDKWIAELSKKEIAIRRKETEDSHQEQLLFPHAQRSLFWARICVNKATLWSGLFDIGLREGLSGCLICFGKIFLDNASIQGSIE